VLNRELVFIRAKELINTNDVIELVHPLTDATVTIEYLDNIQESYSIVADGNLPINKEVYLSHAISILTDMLIYGFELKVSEQNQYDPVKAQKEADMNGVPETISYLKTQTKNRSF